MSKWRNRGSEMDLRIGMLEMTLRDAFETLSYALENDIPEEERGKYKYHLAKVERVLTQEPEPRP